MRFCFPHKFMKGYIK